MKISEAVEMAVRRAQQVKEERVREVKGRKGETDILTVVQGYRGDDPAVCVFTQSDRDMMLTIAHVVAMGFGADTVALTFESYGVIGKVDKDANIEAAARRAVNPDTGKKWGPGEMAKYFEKHGPGVVDEALSTSVYNRAGDSAMVTMRYRIQDRRLTWVDTFNSLKEELGRPGGLVHDAMTEIMSKPTAMQEAARLVPELVPNEYERALFHADMAGMKMFEVAAANFDHEQIAILLCAKPGSLRHQLLRERYDRSMIIDPRNWS